MVTDAIGSETYEAPSLRRRILLTGFRGRSATSGREDFRNEIGLLCTWFVMSTRTSFCGRQDQTLP